MHHTGAVAKVSLALTNDTAICTRTTHQCTGVIYSDACTDMPVTQIGNAVNANIPNAPPALCNASFTTAGVNLTQGVKYWVVVTTSAAATQNAGTTVRLTRRASTSMMGMAGSLTLRVAQVVSWSNNQLDNSKY